MGAVADRLAALGLAIPTPVTPAAAYVPAVRTGSLVFTAGQLPFVDGVLPLTGKVGVDVTPEQAAELAQQCALNALAAVSTVADVESIVRVVKVVGFVASDPSFTQQPVVVNGASNVLKAAFGEAGAHARSAIGMAVLPFDAPVEVELIVEVADEK